MDAGRNWGRNLTYSARQLHRPTSIEELRQIVRHSRGLRPLGSRHSFSSIADTTGDLIEVTSLPRHLEIDPDAATATVDAGVRYGELAPALEAHGWALQNMASLPHITVGGSVATGTHGSGDRNPTLSAAVAALELVTADGELVRLRRGDEGFDGAVVSLGALGVVVRVTLDLVPSFGMRQDSYATLAWGDALENLDELMAAAYSVSAFTNWTGDDLGAVWLKSTGELPEELLGARPVPREAVPDGEGDPDRMTEQGGVEGVWHDRLPHFRLGHTPSNGEELQSEYMVPREHAVEALDQLRRLGERIAPHLHVTELRSIAADELWLSGAHSTDVLSIGFTWRQHPAEVLALLPHLEERLLPLGARPHWGKLFHTRDLEAVYPRLDEFRALADLYDPRGKLRNRYLDERLFS